MLSKTKKVFTTPPPVLCSIASYKIFYSTEKKFKIFHYYLCRQLKGGGMEINMKIAFLGDVAIFSEGLLETNFADGLSEIAAILKQYDMVIANLEVPLTNAKHSYVCKGIHLKSNEKVIEVLKYLNINYVCLANNHIYDFGERGFRDTVNLLNNNNISYYGIGGRKLHIESNGEKISLSGFCCYSTNGSHYNVKMRGQGVNVLTEKNVYKSMKEDKELGYFSIVSFHWGDEYSQLPNERQVRLFNKMVKWNSHILHGHHAHVMQGILDSNNSIAAFNQGNFCFDDCKSPVNPKLIIRQNKKNKESFILSVEIIDNKIIAYDTIGICYENNSICLLDNSKELEVLSGKIRNCCKDDYKRESLTMIRTQKKSNLQKRNTKWLLSKMNYYSIGAKIMSYRNRYLYRKAY